MRIDDPTGILLSPSRRLTNVTCEPFGLHLEPAERGRVERVGERVTLLVGGQRCQVVGDGFVELRDLNGTLTDDDRWRRRLDDQVDRQRTRDSCRSEAGAPRASVPDDR